MPITVPDSLPAKAVLDKENIFIMDESRAVCQDIRALKIGILNLMPVKQATEVQIIRLLANTPLQIELTLVACASHQPKNTSIEHLISFYRCFEDIKDKKFDGFIITGAPVEQLEYEQVTYWQELTEIMKWSKTNVTSTLHICWGALAGLYYHYNIPKYQLQEKVFGIFPHKTDQSTSSLLRGFDDMFYAPHSRYSEIKAEDILKHKNLQILSTSQEAGVYIVESNDKKQVFVTGHSEYEPDTLKDEYERDLKKGLSIEKPRYYFNNDRPANGTTVMWRSHANLLFSNWVNYYVYQETPYML